MFKKIRGNKDIKKLVENFISLSAIQLINMVIPLVTLPYVIRVLGLKNYGVVVLAAAFLTFFNTFTDFSFKITGTRETALYRHSKLKLNYIYSKVTGFQLMLVMVSTVIILIIIFLYKPFYEEKTVFFLTIPMLLGYTVFPDWFFQGMEDMKQMAILTSGIKVFFTIGIFVFMKKPADYWMYPLFNSLGYLGAAFLGQYIILKKHKLKFSIINIKIIKNTFKTNYPIFINQFAPNFYNNITTLLLGLITNTSMVGLYDAIKKILDLGVNIINIISRVVFPFLNRNKNAFYKYSIFMLIITAVLSFLPVIFAKFIFKYIGLHNPESFSILVILAIGVFFYGLYNIYGLNYFIINHMDKYVMRNTLIASITGFVLAYPFIKYWDVVGAAANLTLSRFIMGFGMFYLFYKLKYKQKETL